MGRKNTSNPHDADPDVFHKETGMAVQKARVMAANGMPNENGFHTVRIEVYGDESPYTAPVITPMYGCVWVPEPGTDVAVIFSESDKPWVIGSWYAVDRVDENDIDMPEYTPGDIILGNQNGYIGVRADGTIESSGALGGNSYTDEDAQDAIGGILSTQFTYDDSDDSIDIDPHATDADAHHARYSDEEVKDVVGELVAGGDKVTTTYDDANGTLTIDTSALDKEEVEDAVASLLTGGTGVSLSYDNANDTLTINGFSGDHADLTNVQSDQHHARYSDGEAISAVENNHERYVFSTTNGSDERWIYIGLLADDNFHDSRATIRFYSSVDQGDVTSAEDKTVVFGARGSKGSGSFTAQGFSWGVADPSEDSHIVISEEDVADGDVNYHLYLRLDTWNAGKVVVESSLGFTPDYTTGLSASDVIGTIVYDTETDINGQLKMGEVSLEGRTTDPPSADDGNIWYREDLDEYRGVENGTVVAFDTTTV